MSQTTDMNNQEDYPPPPSLKDRVCMFNTISNKHAERQAINPFSTDKSCTDIQKRRFSKEEYGRPEKGSKSEIRGFKASLEVFREILQLCEIVDKNSMLLFAPHEKKNDCRKVMSFGELFSIYVTVSSKLVGILLRARKQKLIDFEGEVLFQRRDDHVPIILLKPIEEIRKVLNEKIKECLLMIHGNELPIEDISEQQ